MPRKGTQMIDNEFGKGRKKGQLGAANEENRDPETSSFYGTISKPNVE